MRADLWSVGASLYIPLVKAWPQQNVSPGVRMAFFDTVNSAQSWISYGNYSVVVWQVLHELSSYDFALPMVEFV